MSGENLVLISNIRHLTSISMKKRIFTAVDISDEARAKATDYIESLRGEFPQVRVGWEKAEKLHLTLKFFGEVDEKQLAKLTVAVEQTANQISDFNLKITETGVFPSKRNARILWLGVRGKRKICKS